MKRGISYALFGFGVSKHKDCFDFHSYLRGMMLSIRMNRLIYPGWETIIHVDTHTYSSFIDFFEKLHYKRDVRLVQCEPSPLCKSMLWRLKPVFEKSNDGWKYSYVICRDLDAMPTYRDAQCVQYWINKGKAAHAITDSVSHTEPMMGGMIGFIPSSFKDHSGIESWEELVEGKGFDYSRKNTDQELIRRYVYPFFSQPGRDSITQHYFKGMPNTWLSDYHDRFPTDKVGWLSDDMMESDGVAVHLGQSGYNEGPLFEFLRKHWDTDFDSIEAQYPDIFWWTKTINK